jgi:UDPglucose 6-dehydrogenase
MKKFVNFDDLDVDMEGVRRLNKIGVAGCGVVGEATAQALEGQMYEVVRYDIKHHPDTLDELLTCDVVFICVSAPTKNGIVSIHNIVDVIEKLSYEQAIVIKSTVPPMTTKMLYDKYEGTRRILHSPEFLTAGNAIHDAMYPERVYVGIPDESLRSLAEDVMVLLTVWASESEIYDSTTTEMIKYACNGFLTTKVIYSNVIHDICVNFGIDSSTVLASMGADHRIGTSHTTVTADGGRGAGGMCFPKDLAAMCSFGSVNPRAELMLNSLQIINDYYLKASGKDIDIIEALTD